MLHNTHSRLIQFKYTFKNYTIHFITQSESTNLFYFFAINDTGVTNWVKFYIPILVYTKNK